MPTPKIGEVWTTVVDGRNTKDFLIVANVVGNLVTMSNLQGARIRLNWGRLNWIKVQDPAHGSACSSLGCMLPAVCHYSRPSTANIEKVCARHIPRGVMVNIIEEQSSWAWSCNPGGTFVSERCTTCLVDNVEIFGTLKDRSHRMWTCAICGKWWATLKFPDSTERLIETAKTALVPHYGIDKMESKAYDDSTKILTAKFLVKPKETWDPIKPYVPNVFDYILEDEDQQCF